MRVGKFGVFLLGIVLIVGLAGFANALPFNEADLVVDFRDDTVWGGAVSNPIFRAEGILIRAGSGNEFSQDPHGLGIISSSGDNPDLDNIGGNEVLVVADNGLSDGDEQTIGGIWFYGLNKDERAIARWREDGGSLTPNVGVFGDGDDTGHYFLDIDDILVTGNAAIVIQMAGSFAGDTRVVGFTGAAAAVPEPATMLLLVTGLVGIAGLGRKQILKIKKK